MSKSFSCSPIILGIIEDVDVSAIHMSDYCHRSIPVDIDDLCSSIEQKGLLQPITIRPKEDHFQIVAGNRRYQACRRLGLRKVLCHIVELNDQQAFEVSIAENIQRENLTPIEEAKTFQEYASKFGWGGLSMLAKQIGKSVHYVERRIRLLDLPTDVLNSVRLKEIRPSIAEELFCINDRQHQSDFGKLALERKLSSRKVRELVKDFQLNSSCDSGSVYSFYKRMNNYDEKTQRAFDKSISVMKLAMHRITGIMESMEDNWIVYEVLRDHRNALHERIDLLIKEKKKI